MTPFQHISRPSPFSSAEASTRVVTAVTPADLDSGALPQAAVEWAKAAGFKAEAGVLLAVPAEGARVSAALFGLGSEPRDMPFLSGKLVKQLPPAATSRPAAAA